MESELNIVLHDMHYPKIHKPTFNAALDFIRNNKIASLTLGGDQLDFECISHHTKGKGLYRLPGAYHRDVHGFDTDVLTPLEEAISDSTKRVYHIGNHERFENDLVEEHPELQDTINHVKILNLEGRGWKVIPLGHCSKLGKLTVIHGEIVSGVGNQCGKFPSQKAMEIYGTSVLLGHTHSPQSFAKVSPVDQTQKHMSWVAPCCCTVNPAYLRNRPTSWVNGFTIVETHANGVFNVYPVVVTNGRFSFAGKMYGK